MRYGLQTNPQEIADLGITSDEIAPQANVTAGKNLEPVPNSDSILDKSGNINAPYPGAKPKTQTNRLSANPSQDAINQLTSNKPNLNPEFQKKKREAAKQRMIDRQNTSTKPSGYEARHGLSPGAKATVPTVATPQVATNDWSDDEETYDSSKDENQATVTPTLSNPTPGGKFKTNAGGTDSDTRSTKPYSKQNDWMKKHYSGTVRAGKYSDGLDRLKLLAGI